MEDNGVHLTSMIFCPSLNFEPCSTVFKCSVTVGHRSAVYMWGGGYSSHALWHRRCELCSLSSAHRRLIYGRSSHLKQLTSCGKMRNGG